jgi:dTDP-4-dehydrorhamnose reductase
VRLLVLGANGQVGRELVEHAEAAGVACRAFDRAGADLSRPEEIFALVKRERPDVVANCAAYTAVDQAETDSETAFLVNRDAPAAAARACAETGAALVHFSTDYVFDGAKNGAYVESDATSPLSVYGRSKAEGEREIRRRHHRHVILRTSWVYAAHGKNFLRTMLRLGAERDELRVVDDQHGAPTSAVDLAAAALAVARKLHAERAERVLPPYGTYHCTAAGETTWRGFAEEIFAQAAERLGRRPRVVPIATEQYPTPARRPRNSVLDNARFAAAFGLPRREWRAGVSEALERLFAPAGAKGVT